MNKPSHFDPHGFRLCCFLFRVQKTGSGCTLVSLLIAAFTVTLCTQKERKKKGPDGGKRGSAKHEGQEKKKRTARER